ncbi:CG12056 [Drosophila busckii]|uniref:CG12056 n=1 Tax=Drosophila busckii TaxID=30019 RepID=A0A0M4EN84_DROBS|nr:neuferricin homolog [Drosophila busckii]ALC49384.1 CG12056 [Drosophila busckii]
MFGSVRFTFLMLVAAALTTVYQKEVQQLASIVFMDEKLLDEEIAANEFKPQPTTETVAIITAQQLAECNGRHANPCWLAVLGAVFDVSKCNKENGHGCCYKYLVGTEASVALVHGKIDGKYPKATDDDVLKLNSDDLLQLAKLMLFYEQEYAYKGKLIGRFYDAQGKLTDYHKKLLLLLAQAAKVKALSQQKEESLDQVVEPYAYIKSYDKCAAHDLKCLYQV